MSSTTLSSGELDNIYLANMLGLLPGVSLVELAEEGTLVVLVACAVEIVEGFVVVGAAVEEVEEAEEEEEML